MAVKSINNVDNASVATAVTPSVPGHNEAFRHVVAILDKMQDTGQIEVDAEEDEETESAPILPILVNGNHVVEAVKSGYVFRKNEDGRMILRKKIKSLYLRILPVALDSWEVQVVVRLLELEPGKASYHIKWEPVGQFTDSPKPLGHDTLYVRPRTMMEVLEFLSKGVCLPPEHIAQGLAPMTRDETGHLYDWTSVTAGLFRVCSSRHRPKTAAVVVKYHDYWFYIADSDVQSKAVMTQLQLLLYLQAPTRPAQARY